MSNYVFVLDQNKISLDPTHPAKARKLLKAGRAKVFKRYPFTIIMQDLEVEKCKIHQHRLKLDPGSKTTGIALLQDSRVLWGAELNHRGSQIRDSLLSRRQLRRGRRSRKTRCRKPRFLNRKRLKAPLSQARESGAEGWLPPSLRSRIHNLETWIRRLRKCCPITTLSQELVRFDLQKMENPEISGIEYQQGTLFNYEVKEYLLDKWNRQCAYCGASDTPLEIEHIKPRRKGGTNRISNLAIACCKCNQEKGTQDIDAFLFKKPSLLKRILSQSKKPLLDATAVNATRWRLFESLKGSGLPVETGSGGLTKFNRKQNNLPKTHWLDAACVGKSTPSNLKVKIKQPLLVSATGHGSRQMCRTDRYGFPKRYVPRHKFVKGFQTGDIVVANVIQGKKKGTYTGRVAVRSSGSFNIKTKPGLIQGISHKSCRIAHRKDGFSYAF